VTEKTKELNLLVEQLNEKSSNRTLKDLKIGELQAIIQKLREEARLAEDINTEKRDDVRKMRVKMENMQQDRKFLYMHARDEKQRARELEKKLDETTNELDEVKTKLE
jgi:uncharacterized lipoprotein